MDGTVISYAVQRLPWRVGATWKPLIITWSIISMLQSHGCTKDSRRTMSRKRHCCFSNITPLLVWEGSTSSWLRALGDVFSKRPWATSAVTALGDWWAAFAIKCFLSLPASQATQVSAWLWSRFPARRAWVLLLLSPGSPLQPGRNISEVSHIERIYIFHASPVA